jgi:hypothetical protein
MLAILEEAVWISILGVATTTRRPPPMNVTCVNELLKAMRALSPVGKLPDGLAAMYAHNSPH